MKQIVGCKRNQWRLDASIMRLGVVGPVPPIRKKEAVEVVKSTFGDFLGPFPDVWAPIFHLSIFNVCKNILGWVPLVVGGGGSSGVGHGTTSSASTQTLLVLN